MGLEFQARDFEGGKELAFPGCMHMSGSRSADPRKQDARSALWTHLVLTRKECRVALAWRKNKPAKGAAGIICVRLGVKLSEMM